jgi:hypothetical protein
MRVFAGLGSMGACNLIARPAVFFVQIRLIGAVSLIRLIA